MNELQQHDRPFETLLEFLKQTRGFDFSGYKPASLRRRIAKRMELAQVDGYDGYLDYLEVHPHEFTHLFNTILINVTGFFRDPGAWEYLSGEVIPRVLTDKAPGEPVRMWCAGVSSGEEAYTLAMVLAEAMGEEQYLERAKIYATDVDEDALARARLASYQAREVEAIPEPLLNKYFEQVSDRFNFRKDLRRTLIFGRHDLLQDPPIPRLDLLVCRNTLMYFNSEAQGRILTRFHFALNDTGFLFLGKAEMLFTHASLFHPVDLKRRIFSKSARVDLRDRLLVMLRNGQEDAANHLAKHMRFREAAFDSGTVPQIVVDLNGTVAMMNERARLLFQLATHDAGRQFLDLEVTQRLPRLRGCLQQVLIEKRPINMSEAEYPRDGQEPMYLDIQAVPLANNGGSVIGVSFSFTDVTARRRLQQDFEHTGEELETSLEELQSTNEELETTNEALQSTIEELETTNEELQSTNEELETMNEEQQATNEELQTLNDELQRRTEESDQANRFLSSIMSSLRSGVVVLDSDLRVQIWSLKSEDLWGLRADEVVGQHFLNLDIGLPVERLRQPIRSTLAGDPPPEDVITPATNRRGKPIQCRVSFAPLTSADRKPRGIILVMDDQPQAETMSAG